MSKLTDYLDAYRASATRQLADLEIQAWMKARVPADEAAAWANLNYYPGECADLRAQGITPAMAAAMEDAETDVAGGEELRAMQVVDQLHATGLLADPSHVVQQVDPDDPNHIIVTIRPEPGA